MKNSGLNRGLGTRFDQPGKIVDLSRPDEKPQFGHIGGVLGTRWCCKCQQNKEQKGGKHRMGMWFCADCK